MIWVKWAPNLASSAAAFCTESLPPLPSCSYLVTTIWIRPISRPKPVSGTRWPLPHRLPRFPSEQYLTRPQPHRHGNPALQSQGGPDKTAGQIVQGAGQPTRPTLSASGTEVRRQYQAWDGTSLETLDQVCLSFHASPSSFFVGGG